MIVLRAWLSAAGAPGASEVCCALKDVSNRVVVITLENALRKFLPFRRALISVDQVKLEAIEPRFLLTGCRNRALSGHRGVADESAPVVIERGIVL